MPTNSANDNHKRSIQRAILVANDNVKISDMSSAAGMSAFHFSRKFKAITGLPPHQYLLQQRISQSKILLSASERSIACIAFDCGFSSQAHFSVAFKARVGISPGAYRAKAKNP
jgi:AraC-like DNA-binding protein